MRSALLYPGSISTSSAGCGETGFNTTAKALVASNAHAHGRNFDSPFSLNELFYKAGRYDREGRGWCQANRK